ncbi:O-antigen polymerase [Williamsia sterculiae]|uniref:Oligosaccharide repeat unit polymerase n=1 Tax=Williamsia sterculiae TaxID=1344003 RepID=A0A1N7CI01_9NOCA|nr:O-antigen polymerase [Williamsia sterculiae]SIR63205.1 oligosaccharide repeat unit polymerase [Williamsia sterculiae]
MAELEDRDTLTRKSVSDREQSVSDAKRSIPLRVWWLSPVSVSIVVAFAAIIPTVFVDDQRFRTLWRSPKSIGTHTFLLFGTGALTLALGALIAISLTASKQSHRRWPSLTCESHELLRRASIVLTGLTVFGYLGFGVLIARAGITPAELTTGSPAYGPGAPIRDTVGTIPGVTTCTQFGIAAVVVSTTLLVQRFSRGELIRLLVVLGLAVPRAYIFSERLAILELVVPTGAILCAGFASRSRSGRAAVQFVPAFAVPLVAAVFAGFEYFRSWKYFKTTTTEGFGQFALDRLAGYYATSLNNGDLILKHVDWPGRLPFDTLAAFWTAPGVQQVGLYELLGHHDVPYSEKGETASAFTTALAQFGNPEFNNPSGYVGPFIDYGIYGGLIYFLVAGLLIGYLYRSFCNGSPFGLMLYPVFFIGLVELPRYMHWAQGRTTYAWLALLIIALLLHRQTSRSRLRTHART